MARRHTPQYEAYLRSPEWQARREQALRRAKYRCQFQRLLWCCGSQDRLQVHHKNYERLGHEWPEDLIVLCKKHHREADKKRRRGE